MRTSRASVANAAAPARHGQSCDVNYPAPVVSHASPEETIRVVALTLLVMVLSLTVHECAHAWAARQLGDDTAERMGRLSLSPVSHVDPIGTLLLPVMSIVFGGGMAFIGWARPTPVRPQRFRRGVDMRSGMAVVAVAGPLSNLLLACLSAGALSGIVHFAPALLGPHPGESGLVALLWAMFQINVGLCTFNLLPIPPLDGSRLLPRSMDELQAQIAPYSFIVLMLVLNFPLLRRVLIAAPFEVLFDTIARAFQLA